MADESDIVTGNQEEKTKTSPMHVNIRMQEGEHSGQPLYSNFTTAHAGQGVIIVDFGFLDPQTISALNRMVRSGEKTPDSVNVKMSCRMAVSIDAANHLLQQLNQLLSNKEGSQVQVTQQDVAHQMMEASSSSDTSSEKGTSESRQSGFRFPWSKKTH